MVKYPISANVKIQTRWVTFRFLNFTTLYWPLGATTYSLYKPRNRQSNGRKVRVTRSWGHWHLKWRDGHTWQVSKGSAQLTDDFHGRGCLCLSVGVPGRALVHAALLRVDLEQVQGDVIKVVGWAVLVAWAVMVMVDFALCRKWFINKKSMKFVCICFDQSF